MTRTAVLNSQTKKVIAITMRVAPLAALSLLISLVRNTKTRRRLIVGTPYKACSTTTRLAVKRKLSQRMKRDTTLRSLATTNLTPTRITRSHLLKRSNLWRPALTITRMSWRRKTRQSYMPPRNGPGRKLALPDLE